MGGGERYIPVSEIRDYCEIVGLDDPDDRIEFLELIRAMDYAFLDERRKRAEANKAKDKRTKRGK